MATIAVRNIPEVIRRMSIDITKDSTNTKIPWNCRKDLNGRKTRKTRITRNTRRTVEQNKYQIVISYKMWFSRVYNDKETDRHTDK